MFGIGTSELLIVGVIALLLFGDRLPQIMRQWGSSVSQFKKGLDDVNRDLRRELMSDSTNQTDDRR